MEDAETGAGVRERVFTPDLSVVIVDPSRAAGRRGLVVPSSKPSVAADGPTVEPRHGPRAVVRG